MMADDLATLAEPDQIVPPATPAVVSQPVQPEDPFAEDDKSGQFVSEQRPSLIERMKSHFNKAVTTETPFGAASHFGDSAIERAARERGQIAEFENDNIDRAIKTREQLAQYDRMPGSEGFLEYGAAIIGHVAGNVADPTSAIGNVVKVPYLAGKAFLGTVGKFGVSEAAGLAAGRMAEFGVNQAIINTATDPVVQGLNIASKDGTRTSYDPFQTFVEAPIGGFVGGALLKGAHEAGSALFIKRPVEKQTLDQLVELRDQGGDAKTADIAAAVQGKSDAELGQMASDIHAAEVQAAPVEPPAPISQAVEPIQPPSQGAVHRVATPDGQSVDVKPVVMEASDLITSGDQGYDAALQPRERDRAASQMQVRDMAANLDPERLGHSTEADRGAPIIGPDNMVESGNGRIMAIREAYSQGGDAAQRYRDWIATQVGPDELAGFKNPVIVRQRVTDMTPEQRQAFTVSANQSATLSLSAPERAMADSRLITPDSLDLIRNPDDLRAAANRDFIRSFIGQMPQSEQGALMNAEGSLSAEGMSRVRNAVLAKAYGNSPILGRISEATSDDIKSISNAMVSVAPTWAKLRADVQAGHVRSDIDLTDALVEAITRTADLRSKGIKLDTHLAQQDAFNQLPSAVEGFMRMFYDPSGRRANSAARVADGLRFFAEEARKVTDGGLDLGLPPVTTDALQKLALEKMHGGQLGPETTLFHRSGSGDGARVKATGGEVFGRGPGEGSGRIGDTGAGRDQAGQAGTRPAELNTSAIKLEPGEKIDRAAIKIGDKIYRGYSHTDALDRASKEVRITPEEFAAQLEGHDNVGLDGFVTTKGRYLTRLEAYAIQDSIEAQQRATSAIGDDLAKSYGGEKTLAAFDAYHGSPYEFDSFDLSKVGTGQGAQSYGHGFYLAENQGVARSYRDQLAGANAGHLYRVSIKPEPREFLQWDEAIPKDSPARALLKDMAQKGIDHHEYGVDRQLAKDAYIAASNPNLTGEGLYRQLTSAIEAARPVLKAEGNPRALFGATAHMASDELSKIGVPGIRYLDQGSRASGDGTHNYVVFDPKHIEITDKNGKPVSKKVRDEELALAMGGEAKAATAPSESLAMAVKPQEGSLIRAPEAQQTRSATVDAPNLRSMWTDLAGEFGATVRQGRMVNKKAAGEFGTSSGVIRMKEMDNLTVLAHEIGHHVEYKYGDPLRTLMDAHIGELGSITGYSRAHADPNLRRSEGFAEFFRLFAENPTEAANRAPGFYEAFTRFVDADPKAKNALAKVQAQFEAYRVANAEDLVDINIHTSVEPKGWAKLRADARNNGIINTIAERGSQVYTGLLDEKNTLHTAVRDLLKVQKTNSGQLITLNAVDDPYKLIRLSTNSHQAGMIDMMHGVTPYRSVTPEGPSLHDAIALASGKPNILSGWDEAAVNKFSGYLIARRAVFEWERRAAGLLDKDPMPFSKDVYEKKIEVFERENASARDAADMVHTWTRNLLRKEYEAGLITAESYNGALQIRDYVPLLRDMTDRKSGGGGGSTFDAGQVGLKKFGGSSRPVIDPLQSLMDRSFRVAQLIAHNDAIKALGSLADRAGVGAGVIAERVPAKELKATYVDPLEAVRKGLIEQGVSSEDAKLAVSSMLDDLQINKQSIGPISIFRSEQAAARGENLVFYLDGGEMRALRLKEGDFGRELVDTLTGGLSSPLRDWNLQALQKVSAVMRAGITTSPDFFVTNSARDQLATWVLNRGTLPVVDFMRGIHREVTNSELSRLYAQHGGIAGGANLNALDHARVDKDIQSLANKGFTVKRLASWKGYFKAVELSETGSRLGLFEVAYKRAKKQGLNDYDAAVEATFTANDNLDFGRHGSRIGATVKIIPFLNAQLQGLDKAYRTLVAPAFAERLTTGDVEAQKTMISAYTKIAALTGLSMALRAAYIDDPEYSELPDYLRNTHWVVRVPGIKGGSVVDALGRKIETPAGLQNLWLAIPKPFELAILPNLGERAVEMLALQDPKALARWAWGAKDLVTAKWMLDSVGVKMAAELTSGKNFFTGREIVPDAIRGREAWAQATSGTSAISKAIGKSVDRAQRAMGGDGGGISPMYIDHIIQGVGGSWGRTFLALSDQAIGTKGDQSLADTAISRRVFKEAYRGSTSINEFWNQVQRENGQFKQAATTYRSMASVPADAASYVARLPEDKRAFVILNQSDFPADQKRLHPLYRAELASQAISSMTKQIADRDLTSAASGGKIELSSSEQRVALDSLGRIRMWEARNALIASGAASLKGQKPGNIQAEFDMLKATVPAVYNELAQRYANAKVYKASAVADHWGDVRKSLIDDGSDAKLSSIAKDVSRQGYELDMTRDKAKKVRAKIPGVTLQ